MRKKKAERLKRDWENRKLLTSQHEQRCASLEYEIKNTTNKLAINPLKIILDNAKQHRDESYNKLFELRKKNLWRKNPL